MNIQMVDLSRQLEPIKGGINTAIQEVLEATNFIHGKPVKVFRRISQNG